MQEQPSLNRRPSASRTAAISAGLTALLLLAGCTIAPTTTETRAPATSAATAAADAILAPYAMEGWSAEEIIDALEQRPLNDRPSALRASIRPDALLLSDEQGREASVPLPVGRTYVSFAPYVTTTHDCGFHSLTTCTGELGDEPVTITVTDLATGDVIVDEAASTEANGFVGLWLPRADALEVTIEAAAGSATAQITTDSPDDPTCITTMQLT